MTKLFETQENIDMGWCQAWINKEDESKFIICLEGRNALTGADVTVGDLDGFRWVPCNKCPLREQCEQMEMWE